MMSTGDRGPRPPVVYLKEICRLGVTPLSLTISSSEILSSINNMSNCKNIFIFLHTYRTMVNMILLMIKYTIKRMIILRIRVNI